jgi:predicted nucleotide-binding protein (sugar kinase/HSP70/actin superfamily)
VGALVLAAIAATDRLRDMLYEIRPGEARPGAAEAIYARWSKALYEHLERVTAASDHTAARAIWEAVSGRVWGIPDLLSKAADEFAAARGAREVPIVLIVGEIYVRNVPFSNDGAADALARRGIGSRVASFSEYLQYSDWNAVRNRGHRLRDKFNHFIRVRIEECVHDAAAGAMGWHRAARTEDVLEAARPYLRDALEGEAVLTIGAPVHAWQQQEIDAVLSVGPLECMPNKLAESQFHHAAEREGLLSLTLSLNGDPVDPEVLDAFAFEVHARYRARKDRSPPPRESWVDRLGTALGPEAPPERMPG